MIPVRFGGEPAASADARRAVGCDPIAKLSLRANEATAMLFATGYPIPMKPLVVLQLAVKWIGLAVPSAAGRIGLNTLFLRKYGVPPTIAVTQGAIDGFSGFVVEAMILLIAFIASDVTLDIETGDVRWGLILGIVVGLFFGIAVTAALRSQGINALSIPAVQIVGLVIFVTSFAAVLVYVLIGLRDRRKVAYLAGLPLEPDSENSLPNRDADVAEEDV